MAQLRSGCRLGLVAGHRTGGLDGCAHEAGATQRVVGLLVEGFGGSPVARALDPRGQLTHDLGSVLECAHRRPQRALERVRLAISQALDRERVADAAAKADQPALLLLEEDAAAVG